MQKTTKIVTFNLDESMEEKQKVRAEQKSPLAIESDAGSELIREEELMDDQIAEHPITSTEGD